MKLLVLAPRGRFFLGRGKLNGWRVCVCRTMTRRPAVGAVGCNKPPTGTHPKIVCCYIITYLPEGSHYNNGMGCGGENKNKVLTKKRHVYAIYQEYSGK